MRGHIRKRGNKWAVVIHVGKYPNGKPKYKWYPAETEEQAERLCTELLHQMDTNTYIDPGKLTLKEYLTKWLNDYAEPNLAHNTYQNYKGIVNNHLIPSLGHHIITKLQPTHVQEYYATTLKSGRKDGKNKEEKREEKKNGKTKKEKDLRLSPSSVLKHHRILHEALNHAIEWQLVGRNVCDAVTPPQPQAPDADVLDKPELDFLLDIAKGEDIYIPVVIAAYTGMRRGEILALRWKDIDLQIGMITVKQAVYWDRERKIHDFKKTKGKCNRRVDIMPEFIPQLVAILTNWKTQQKKNRAVLGKDYQKNDLVCTMPDGRMVSLDHCTKAFERLALKCRLDINFHGLRHTHATLLMKEKVPPKVVAERLGHADEAFVLKRYSHVTPSIQRDAVQALGRIFQQKT